MSDPLTIWREIRALTGERPRRFLRLFREVWEKPYVVVPPPDGQIEKKNDFMRLLNAR